MDMSPNRLEASSRIEERAFENPAEQRRRRTLQKTRNGDPAVDSAELTPDGSDAHALDDLA